MLTALRYHRYTIQVIAEALMCMQQRQYKKKIRITVYPPESAKRAFLYLLARHSAKPLLEKMTWIFRSVIGRDNQHPDFEMDSGNKMHAGVNLSR